MEKFTNTLQEYVKKRAVPSGKPGFFTRNKDIKTDVYATCDVVNILYTINKMDLTIGEKLEFADAINSFQNPLTGQFDKSDHRSEYHSTAMAVSALKLLGAQPKYPLVFLEELKAEWEAIICWLNKRDWDINPWNGCGHDVPAVMSIFANLELVNLKWFDKLFNWLDEQQSDRTGMWPKNSANNLSINHLGSAFHFYFMYEHFKRPINYAPQIIESTLSLQKGNGSWLNEWPAGFIDLDATYTLSRLSRFNQELRYKSIPTLKTNAMYTLSKIQNSEELNILLEDTHNTLGTLQNLAVLQEVFPNLVSTYPQLRLVLNYSPFI
ncbi:hypothetical protein COE08_26895 [Priestia megaterium]|uniref:hypothetical protein n=1 Tax=Priestia megaterium TaxID=1404 RepID=UPI000BFE9A07|nr:hypothetical protein [Priestia megaterium]PGH75123.1 hypothetical protein CN890_04050 [Priestia megaterium]PGX15975.1 hypothetical protein COE08_26895 [Priestia megaterium]